MMSVSPSPALFDYALLSAAQSKQADALCASRGISVETLMENAGAAIADILQERFAPGRITVLCGPGNNGGDGLVAARLLHTRGWEVQLCEIGTEAATPLQKAMKQAYVNAGGRMVPLNDEALNASGLILDALLGTGLTRALEGPMLQAVQRMNQARVPVIAVDIPTGLNADSGAVMGEAARAFLTISFGHAKPGHFLLPGKDYCGRVEVADIGIPDEIMPQIAPELWLNHPSLWQHEWNAAATQDHKYSRGQCLIRGGPLHRTGAAKLAAIAAARAGCGLTKVACDTPSLPVYAATFLSVMTEPVATVAQFHALCANDKLNAILVGPGNGLDDGTRGCVLAALESGKNCVLDADALTAFAHDAKALLSATHHNTILTPHEGEFARLFPDIAASNETKPQRAVQAASRAGCIIVLKGSDTVIAAPDGRCVINANAPPTLATAGTGDVLAGIITGLLAQSVPPFYAACAGVWLHGAAATHIGTGLMAEDLLTMIPHTIQTLSQEE